MTRSWEQLELPLREAITLRLPAYLWLDAANIGAARSTHAKANGYTDKTRWNDSQRLASDALAAITECAVALYLDVPWNPVLGSDRERGDLDLPYAGPAEVRSTDLPDGCLIVYEGQPDQVCVLVCGPFIFDREGVTMRCPGWLEAHDAKRPHWWREPPHCHTAAWFVPQDALKPLDSLKRWTEGKGS